MRVTAKFKAAVGKAIKTVYHEHSEARIATMIISFDQDPAELARRFTPEFADVIFKAAVEVDQKNLPLEAGTEEHDVRWLIEKFDVKSVFETHTLKIGSLGAFSCTPEFKGISSYKGARKVSVKLALPLIVETLEDAGALVMMTGEIQSFEFSTQLTIAGNATPPKVVKTDGPFGNPTAQVT